MPTLFRPMKTGADKLPVVGSSSRELGVRVPPNLSADVEVDENQFVVLNGQGMSVAEHWQYLPGHLIPKRLKSRFPAATGANSLACFKMGVGAFVPDALSDTLRLVLKQGNSHGGNVTPSQQIHINEFQKALAATRSNWEIDEELP